MISLSEWTKNGNDRQIMEIIMIGGNGKILFLLGAWLLISDSEAFFIFELDNSPYSPVPYR